MSIRMQADDFFNAYKILSEDMEALTIRLEGLAGKPLVSSKEPGTRPTGGVNIVCLAFTVELYIKDLHFKITGEAPRSHNILKLFNKLPEQIQQEIFAHDSISQNPFVARGDSFSQKKYTKDYSSYDGFIDQISLISDGFEKWRYSYESTSLGYNTWFAIALIESVKAVADTLQMRS
jgi:hypothetical protein